MRKTGPDYARKSSRRGRIGVFALDFAVQPGPRERPEAIRRPRRDAECLAGVRQRQAREIPQLDELRGGRIGLGQPRQGLIQGDQILARLDGGQVQVGHIVPDQPAAMFVRRLPTRLVNQDAPHRLGRRRKKMPAVVPLRAAVVADQAQIGFVDERRRLQGLAGLLLGQFLRCELPQLLLDQRQELLRRLRFAAADGIQKLRDLVHGACGIRSRVAMRCLGHYCEKPLGGLRFSRRFETRSAVSGGVRCKETGPVFTAFRNAMSWVWVWWSELGLIGEMRVLPLPGHRDICRLARRSWLGNGNGFQRPSL